MKPVRYVDDDSSTVHVASGHPRFYVCSGALDVDYKTSAQCPLAT